MRLSLGRSGLDIREQVASTYYLDFRTIGCCSRVIQATLAGLGELYSGNLPKQL